MGKDKGKGKGDKHARKLAEQNAALAAEREAAEAERRNAMAEAGAEADAEPLSKAERKALKAARKLQEASLAANTGVTVAEAADTIAVAEATAPKAKGKRKFRDLTAEKAHANPTAIGETVTATPIPDATGAALKTPSGAELQALAAEAVAVDPGETVTPGTGSSDTVVSAPAAVEPEGVEPVERDQWGRPKVLMPDGSERGYRRVTTFIDVLEDKSSLNDWGKRMVLEGTTVDYRTAGHSDLNPSLVVAAGKALDTRDAALAELDAVEGEGKVLLTTNLRRQEALRAFKDAMNKLVERAEDTAGAHDKATKGTDLHAMTELVDQGLPLPDNATAADRRDLKAYAMAVEQAGLKFIDRERFVVLDDLKVGGTLDRSGLFKFRGTSRARRCVIDIKTGRVDYSPGKIAMQLATYAHGLAYDRDTRQRTDLKLDKTKALLIHLPAGEGKCSIIEVDISTAWTKAVRLANELFEWRSEGKKVFDTKAPVAFVDLSAEPLEDVAA